MAKQYIKNMMPKFIKKPLIGIKDVNSYEELYSVTKPWITKIIVTRIQHGVRYKEDLLQESFIFLIHIHQKYDASYGKTFLSFMYQQLIPKMVLYVHRMERGASNGFVLPEYGKSDLNGILEFEDNLCEKDIIILNKHFVEGEPLRMIGKRLGLSKQGVSWRLTKLYRTLKTELGD